MCVCVTLCVRLCLLQRDRVDGEIIETGVIEIAETAEAITTEAVCLH